MYQNGPSSKIKPDGPELQTWCCVSFLLSVLAYRDIYPLAGFHGLPLQVHGQDTFVIGSFQALLVNSVGDGKAALKRVKGVLPAVVVFLFAGGFLFLLGADCQYAIFQRDVEVLLLHTRYSQFDGQAVLRFRNISGREILSITEGIEKVVVQPPIIQQAEEGGKSWRVGRSGFYPFVRPLDIIRWNNHNKAVLGK
jgi:hypothetical protein